MTDWIYWGPVHDYEEEGLFGNAAFLDDAKYALVRDFIVQTDGYCTGEYAQNVKTLHFGDGTHLAMGLRDWGYLMADIWNSSHPEEEHINYTWLAWRGWWDEYQQ